VDNIGDNRHNQLLRLSIFLTKGAASQTQRLTKLIEKAALLELCLEHDACPTFRDSVRALSHHPAHLASLGRDSLGGRVACPFRFATRQGGIEVAGRLFL
jgi:hypothetical protein